MAAMVTQWRDEDRRAHLTTVQKQSGRSHLEDWAEAASVQPTGRAPVQIHKGLDFTLFIFPCFVFCLCYN